ncbi:restriction endonuclease [Saprospira grandis]|uniref:restriction endonuclease n=1 Tax=Saprospira grandis TaxID=1008 RepID=UPI0022DD2E70|nr:restriction endonuclease [Saprospira grandis]WBM74787.1 restriction endonuclease [Saprospira grandis]
MSAKLWKLYEEKIHQELSLVYKNCDFFFDDRIFGKYSRVDRQIDISIRGNLGGEKILGVVDCKYFSKRIDVKIVESFLGMIEDVKANFGLIITNKGYSEAAKNRVSMKNLNVEILDFDSMGNVTITLDYLFNKHIKSLDLSKYEFFNRCSQNWALFDREKSSYEKRSLVFRAGHANTEYYAYKKIIKASARCFRDFNDLTRIRVEIPVVKDTEEALIYYSEISRRELEDFLELNFESLKEDIELWRTNFISNSRYTKASIYEFAEKYIQSKK